MSKWLRTCSVDPSNVVANVDINNQKHFCVEQICLFLKEIQAFVVLFCFFYNLSLTVI